MVHSIPCTRLNFVQENNMKKILFGIVVLLSVNLLADELRTDIPVYTGEWSVAAIMFYHNIFKQYENNNNSYDNRYYTMVCILVWYSTN